jgi:glycosyltransferase involved in cell wall biosynthesis
MGIAHREEQLSGNVWGGRLRAKYIRLLEIACLKRSDLITTINYAHEREIRILVKKPIYVLRDAVDPERYGANEPPVTSEQTDKKAVRLIFVGSMMRRKLDMLMRILPKAFASVPNLEVLIIGSGPDIEYYRSKVDSLGQHRNRVRFIGYVSDEFLPDYIGASDIAFSDFWTQIGFPLKVFQYMAMRKAILIPDGDAIREVLTDGKDSIFYKDADGLLAGIVMLASSNRIRERLGQNARELILQRHTWAMRGRELVTIYNGFLRGQELAACATA